MKKFFAIAALTFVLCVSVFAMEEGIFVMHDLGDYKIVSTQRVPHAWPHVQGPSYLYYSYGVTDMNGNFLAEPVYDEIQKPVDGMSVCRKDSLYGYFDENWNLVVEPKYTAAGNFSEGLANVSVGEWGNSKCGYIDKSGNVVIPLIYDRCEPFENGIASVAYENEGYHYHSFYKWGKIDREGNVLEPFGFVYEKEYEVGVAPNNIRINGVDTSGEKFEYPFVYHRGVAYIPLTYYGSRALGFSCDWSPETGIVLSEFDGTAGTFEGKSVLSHDRNYTAQLYEGKITIGEKTYTSVDVYYPLLSLENIVYIPVLWREGMESLGITYKYELDTNSLVFDFE